ncbi:MAG TPA: tRNA pseudouridine(55) synthase TruB [Clostridiales bacterium UBA8153]|nr:tRNA pseudouridine(55) synthase TruB [Clostridiales bacterium UBA8153]
MNSGVLNVLKPPGMTSHQVVAWVRRLTGERRAGHTGTLDPAAAGVLPICLGQATRLAEYLAGADKEYRAELVLGLTTDSDDTQGRVIARREAEFVDQGRLEQVLAGFRGELLQSPPALSAVRVGGRRSYQLARAGVPVPLPPRPVTIHRLELLEFLPGAPPRARLLVRCSKGTYIRTLCRELGDSLGCGAALGWLLRTGSGRFALEDAATLEELAGGWRAFLVRPSAAVAHLRAVEVSDDEAGWIRRGRAPARALPGSELVRLLDGCGELVAIAQLAAGRIRLRKVLT